MVLVVVAPAAGTVVVTAESICWRGSGASNNLSARLTGSAKVRAPSRLMLTIAFPGAALGALRPWALMANAT